MLFNPQHEKAVRASSEAGAYAALESRFNARFDERQHGGARRRGGPPARGDAAAVASRTAAFKAADATLAAVRREAVALVKRVSRTRSTPTSTTCSRRSSPPRCPIGLVGSHHRGDLRRRDVVDRRGAELAGDGDGHRLLPAPLQARGVGRSTTCARRGSRPRSGGSSRAASPSTPRRSGRSSRSSIASDRSSTGRCSASSCSRSARRVRPATARSSA